MVHYAEELAVHYAEKLAVQRERQKQLTWKANIEVSSWSSEVDISIFHHGRDFTMAGADPGGVPRVPWNPPFERASLT